MLMIETNKTLQSECSVLNDVDLNFLMSAASARNNTTKTNHPKQPAYFFLLVRWQTKSHVAKLSSVTLPNLRLPIAAYKRNATQSVMLLFATKEETFSSSRV
jgi:hypothetical protein